MLKSQQISLNNTGGVVNTTYTDINFVVPWSAYLEANQLYKVDMNFLTAVVGMTTALAPPTIWCNAFRTNVLACSGTIQSNNIIANALYRYTSATINVNCQSNLEYSHSFMISTLPDESFRIKLLKSNTNALFTTSSGNLNWVMQFTFTPICDCIFNTTIMGYGATSGGNSTGSRFNEYIVNINSANGTQVVSSNNQMTYDLTLSFADPNALYRFRAISSTIPCDASTNTMLIFKQFGLIAGQKSVESKPSATLMQSSRILAVATALQGASTTITPVFGGKYSTAPSFGYLSPQVNFTIGIYTFANALWLPATGSVPDYNISLLIERI
jgi:hypothetical protein